MIHLNVTKSRSSTSSSCALHELAPSLLSSTEGMSEDSSKHAGRRLSKIRTKISATISKSSCPQSILQAPDHTQTLPASRPKMRRTISRSMRAPLQHLFSHDHHSTELEIPERYEAAVWSLGLTKSYSTLFSRKGNIHQASTSDDEDWDFRCQGMAPMVPARPSEDDLSPTSAYNHSLLGSPGLVPNYASLANSSASSCCSSPTTYSAPLRSYSADCPVKKQKISVDNISAPLNLWNTSPTVLIASPSLHSVIPLGLDVHV